MKSIIFAFACIFFIQTVSARSAALDAPKTCEDVLSAETCTKLRDIAKTFHENVQMVNEAVQAAVQKHLSNAQDIIVFVKNYLVEKATNFKCEDVLSADQCSQLQALAQKFKVNAQELIQDIKEAVADGIVRGSALYQKVVQIMLEKINDFSCEQVMDADTCQKIEEFAKKVHASSQELKEAIIDAYSKGLTKAQDFLEDTKEFLKERISCDQVLGADTCAKIQSLAQKFGVQFDKIMEVLREAVANGITKVTDLYKAALKYIMDNWLSMSVSDEDLMELMNMMDETALDAPKTCEDILKAETCTKLRNIAKTFHENVQIVNEAVQAAVQKHLTKAQDIIIFVRNYLVEKATNFKCEDVLSADQCSKLTALAQKFKVNAQQLIQDIKEAVADGIVRGSALYQKVVQIMLEKINDFSCEQVMDAATCQKIEEFAKKIHASSQELKEAIIDAYSKGLTKAQDFLKDAMDFLTKEISCDQVLGSDTCAKIQSLAQKFGAKFEKIMDVLREAVANGVTRISDLYKAAVKYIMENWLSMSLSDEELMEVMDMMEKF